MKIIHHENGDSEYELVVKVHKICSDKRGMSVCVGNLNVNIENRPDGAAVVFMKKSRLKDCHEALDWLLTSLEPRS